GKPLLSPERLLETRSPQMVVKPEPASKEMAPHTNLNTYGLGWAIYDYHGHLVVSHGGGIDGFRSHVTLVPHAKLGIAPLSNLTPTSMPEALRNGLMDLALGLPTRDWDAFFLEAQKKAEAEAETKRKERDEKRHKETAPSRDLSAYTGGYDNPAYG